MVKQIQTVDEYYDPYDDDDDPLAIFYAPTRFETDEQLVIVACLLLLQQRYMVMKSMTPQQIVDEIDSIMSSLETELVATATQKVTNHTQDYLNHLLVDYAIPLGYINIDASMIEIMNDSIKGMINQLGDELKVKGKFFVDNMSKDDFDILPNFKRAVKRVIDAVGINTIYSKEKSKRKVKEFVYGEDKLYTWITANDDKVCEWCRIQEKLPPRTLAEMPLDHPWGRCDQEPINPTYSDEYYIMLARRQSAEAIDIFSENKWNY